MDPSTITRAGIAGLIDLTLLKATCTRESVLALCANAREYRFASVCVNPFWVPLCAAELEDTGIPVCAVVGYPLGSSFTRIKAEEAGLSVEAGAREIDAVINIGAARSGDWDFVERDIRAVVEACTAVETGVVVKVIIETCYLTDREKVEACMAASRAGARFVKTSTGFGPGGATAEDVALMKRTLAASGLRVKASGGIRTLADVLRMLEAGAERIGASAGVAIVRELAS